MIVNYYKDPAPHFIIDEFLTPRAANSILQECIDLQPFYKQALIIGELHSEPDNCKECKNLVDVFRNNVRDNQTVNLNEIYKPETRSESKTLSYLHHKLLDDREFLKLMENSESIFPITNQVNNSQTMISRYGKCEFYGWHIDTIPNQVASRVITVSYYVNKEPNVFKGGRLLLLDKENNTHKTIEPKHNRAVIFPSNTAVHAVEYVDLAGKEWSDGRFSVQFWLGFENGFKFR